LRGSGRLPGRLRLEFFPQHCNFPRRLDAQANPVAADFHDGHFDALADDDGLILMAAEYEHD